MYESDSGELIIALLGDTIPTRRLAVFREEGFLKIRELLHQADAVYSNLEATVHRYLEGAHAQRPEGGTYMTTEPRLLEDVRWMGINMMSCGSTHADDYGHEGILGTLRYLDDAGIVHAGSGRHLAEARAPGYLDTPRGRVALISATGHFYATGRAGAQRRDTPGNPGVNGLRHSWEYQVAPEQLEQLRGIGQVLGWAPRGHDGAHSAGDKSSYDFLGSSFTAGPFPARSSRVDPRDLEANLEQVRLARATADRVIVSLHCHDLDGPMGFGPMSGSEPFEQVADYVAEFAHRCIDEGADIFAGHGPQRPLGVEIYKGRPIFYSLGSFISQLETVRFLPEAAYEGYGLGPEATPVDFAHHRYGGMNRGNERWEQAFAVCEFSGDSLKALHLHPVELGAGRPLWQRGRPVLASGEVSAKIIQRVARHSVKYGTAISFRDGKGVVELQ